MQGRERSTRGRELDGLEDRAFLRELGPWLARAEEDEVSRRALADLRADYAHTLERHRTEDEGALGRLLDLRTRLAGLTGIELEPRPPRPPPAEAVSVSHALIGTIRRELRQLRAAAVADGGATALAGLERDFEAVAALESERHRALIAGLHDSASGSLRRLEWLADEIALLPPVELAVLPGTGPDEALRSALHSVGPLLQAALAERRELTPSEQRQLGHLVAAAREDAERVRERLRPPMGAREVAAHRQARVPAVLSLRRARGYCA